MMRVKRKGPVWDDTSVQMNLRTEDNHFVLLPTVVQRRGLWGLH